MNALEESVQHVAHRLVAICDNALSKLNRLTYVCQELVEEGPEELIEAVGQEHAQTILEHLELESRYEEATHEFLIKQEQEELAEAAAAADLDEGELGEASEAGASALAARKNANTNPNAHVSVAMSEAGSEHQMQERERVASSLRLQMHSMKQHPDDVDPQLQELSLDLTDSTRNLGRILQDNALLYRNLKQILDRKRHRIAKTSLNFLERFAQLREIVQRKVSMTSEEKKRHESLFEDVVFHQKKEARLVQDLKTKLRQERRSHERDILDKEKKIHRLESQIDKIIHDARVHSEQVQRETERWHSEETPHFRNGENEMRQKLDQDGKEFEVRMEDSISDEQRMLRRKVAKERELANLVAQYDRTMIQRYEASEDLQEHVDTEKAELIKLKTFFDELDRKQAIIDSEKERIQRRKKTLDKNIMIWFCAARMIQRYVHGYLEKKRKLAAKRARKERLRAKREAKKLGPR